MGIIRGAGVDLGRGDLPCLTTSQCVIEYCGIIDSVACRSTYYEAKWEIRAKE